MGKKLALNVLYNIGIFVALMIGYWGIEHAQYTYLLAAVFIAGVFISLKIKLLKEVKNTTKQ